MLVLDMPLNPGSSWSVSLHGGLQGYSVVRVYAKGEPNWHSQEENPNYSI